MVLFEKKRIIGSNFQLPMSSAVSVLTTAIRRLQIIFSRLRLSKYYDLVMIFHSKINCCRCYSAMERFSFRRVKFFFVVSPAPGRESLCGSSPQRPISNVSFGCRLPLSTSVATAFPNSNCFEISLSQVNLQTIGHRFEVSVGHCRRRRNCFCSC